VRHDYDDIQPVRSQGSSVSIPMDIQTRKVKRASRLAKEGHLTRAVQALLNPSLPATSQHAIDQLKTLHPSASAPLPASVPDGAHRLVISGADLRAQVRNTRFYDNGSAPGPSGWTGNMLLHFVINAKIGALDALASMLTLIRNGDIHTHSLKQLLLASKLIAAPKPNTNKYRPIAMGEIF